MTRPTHILSAAIITLALLAPQLALAEVEIVATVGDLAAVVEEVGGEHVSVELLASPQEDPHFVDAKPSYVRRASQADLLIFNGMSLEVGWLPLLIENSRNSSIQKGKKGHFDASEHIERKGTRHDKVSRAEGDVHPEGNPHYTFEPRQMARVAVALGKRLAEIDPDHADAYRKQAKEFARKSLMAGRYWEGKFDEIPAECKKVVVYHEAWDYLTDWLGLEVAAAIEPKPGVPPNPRHIGRVLKTIEEQSVPVIIQMEYYPDDNARMLGERTGAGLLRVDGHAREDQSFDSRVNKLAGRLHSMITSRCDP
jgi:zinc/manganese transport system substrate-binding protein